MQFLSAQSPKRSMTTQESSMYNLFVSGITGGNIGARSHVAFSGGDFVTPDPTEVKFVTGSVVKMVEKMPAVVAGQVQEQLQQSIFGRGNLETGMSGCQFWKTTGSPFAHWIQVEPSVLLMLGKYLRRPIQCSDFSMWTMIWMFSGVRLTRSL